MKRIMIAVLATVLCIPMSFASDAPLRIVAPWEVKGMDPTGSGFILTRMQIAETLVDVDAAGQLIPGLARDWTVSDDRLTWTFQLRSGVTYHNGEAMTAETVAVSLNYALEQSSVLKTSPVTAIEAVDGDIRVSLSWPFSPLAANLTHFSTLILSSDSYQDGKVVQLSGTGPYQLTQFEPPQSLAVSAFSHYWGEQPRISEARYLAVGRGETRALLAESGDADIVYTLDPNSLRRLQQRQVVAVHAEPIPRTVVIKVNAAHPVLADVAVRRAISDAIDREGIALGVLRDTNAAAGQLFPPIMGDWHDPELSADATDPEAVRARLAELGWHPGDDGILVKAGERLELNLVTYSSRPLLPVIATAIQDQLRTVGIELDVSIENSSAVPQGHHDGTLELALIARNYGSVVDPLGTLLVDYDEAGSDWGAMNWNDANLTRHLGQLQEAVDPAERFASTRAISRTLNTEMPTIPVVFYQHTAAVHTSLGGFTLDPFDRSYWLTQLYWQ